MKVLGLTQYGGPDALGVVELPEPHAKTGEVRVKVTSAGINPVDVMVRDGSLKALFQAFTPPYVPGMDLAGIIDEIGDEESASLLGLHVGDAVLGVVDNIGSYGAYSEYVCLPIASVALKPSTMSFPQAGSFLMNALTAQTALDALPLSTASTLLVTGAAGAVGANTVVLAHTQGVRVIAVASQSDETFVRDLGAEYFVARGDAVNDQILGTLPDGVDAIIDTANLQNGILPSLGENGSIAVLRPWAASVSEGIHIVHVNVRERLGNHAAIEQLIQMAADGLLPLRVAGIYPASQVVAAHQRFDAGGLRGRLVLDFEEFK
jgi:NADPH:quinone reductase-like Zn-dependent oxidoreductase